VSGQSNCEGTRAHRNGRTLAQSGTLACNAAIGSRSRSAGIIDCNCVCSNAREMAAAGDGGGGLGGGAEYVKAEQRRRQRGANEEKRRANRGVNRGREPMQQSCAENGATRAAAMPRDADDGRRCEHDECAMRNVMSNGMSNRKMMHNKQNGARTASKRAGSWNVVPMQTPCHVPTNICVAAWTATPQMEDPRAAGGRVDRRRLWLAGRDGGGGGGWQQHDAATHEHQPGRRCNDARGRYQTDGNERRLRRGGQSLELAAIALQT
jgi:hypothetical protein